MKDEKLNYPKVDGCSGNQTYTKVLTNVLWLCSERKMGEKKLPVIIQRIQGRVRPRG